MRQGWHAGNRGKPISAVGGHPHQMLVLLNIVTGKGADSPYDLRK